MDQPQRSPLSKIKIGLLLIGASIALAGALLPFENPRDPSIAGLAITVVAIPTFLVGVVLLARGVISSLGRKGRLVVHGALATGLVAAAIPIWRESILWPFAPHVSRLVLETDQAQYSGPCPVTVTVRARITVNWNGGPVAYEFRGYTPTRSTGEVFFDAPGTKTVTAQLKFGLSGYARSGPGDPRVRILRYGGPEAHDDFRYVCTN